ncbi:transcriptional regulator [Pragia fontium]|uniref:Transcriptional regulator n=1 Tax=Pragia fontium TaxID=82985 RepID=A0ABQ5LKS0_9GAMM|nr:MerR family transcriptional regulator [Pragia fontium]AKJ43322.1 MerR family transcriptional regulator [Pragia fontium]GKX64150.1 transcriptional regulator [Pragia fontium]
MKIGTLAKRTGLTAHTLRYYERLGLLPHVHRDASGQRHYDEATLNRIDFLSKMRTTGMPLRDMLRYVELVAAGSATEDQRRMLLEDHRENVRARLTELQNCLLVLDKKISGYCSHPTHDKTGDSK